MLELFKDYHFNLYSKHVFIDTRQFIYNRAFRSYLCILLQQRFSLCIYTHIHTYIKINIIISPANTITSSLAILLICMQNIMLKYLSNSHWYYWLPSIECSSACPFAFLVDYDDDSGESVLNIKPVSYFNHFWMTLFLFLYISGLDIFKNRNNKVGIL